MRKVLLAIPTSELPRTTNKLLSCLMETRESLLVLCVPMLGGFSKKDCCDELLFARLMSDEGVNYNSTVKDLHQEFVSYLSRLETTLFLYMGEYISQCSLEVISVGKTTTIVECSYDYINSP